MRCIFVPQAARPAPRLRRPAPVPSCCPARTGALPPPSPFFARDASCRSGQSKRTSQVANATPSLCPCHESIYCVPIRAPCPGERCPWSGQKKFVPAIQRARWHRRTCLPTIGLPRRNVSVRPALGMTGDTLKLSAPSPAARGRALPMIRADRCTGCGRCVAVCPPHVLSLHAQGLKKKAMLDDAPDCTGCALCWVHCPFDAIRMVRRQALAAPGAFAAPIDSRKLLP